MNQSINKFSNSIQMQNKNNSALFFLTSDIDHYNQTTKQVTILSIK
ncbi:hypothetical protein NARC_70177 [Candidatus Nitrosocosmicus arcticus]|uniref:Uncharacterized protein n=1 Tax=Candidatus Nitrosocosmicus arcticus TaxID=2035267 RepID=A0A557SVG9_9ARCH|nr:hypothetical protein NARC_70177 [Candidatus Nitrosocosmicus arcticus]